MNISSFSTWLLKHTSSSFFLKWLVVTVSQALQFIRFTGQWRDCAFFRFRFGRSECFVKIVHNFLWCICCLWPDSTDWTFVQEQRAFRWLDNCFGHRLHSAEGVLSAELNVDIIRSGRKACWPGTCTSIKWFHDETVTPSYQSSSFWALGCAHHPLHIQLFCFSDCSLPIHTNWPK